MRHFTLLVACLLLVACDLGGPTPSVTPTPTLAPTPTPTPAQLSAQVGRATLGSQSFHFAIALSGKPVYADPSEQLAILGVDGDLKRPDGVQAIVKGRAAAAIIDVRLVSLAGKQYITNPITRQWQCAPAGSVFDPVVLFDAGAGVEYLLQNAFENVELVGTEDLAGRPNLRLRGSIAGPRLMAISANSLGLGRVNADLWADSATMRITQIVLVDPATDANNPTTWKITFSEYDKALDVRAPPGAQC
jgi:lipoprotein LprG